jgi:hypothetical protein
MDWVVIILTAGYGLFYVGWPQKARQQYLAHFDVDTPTKWYRPNTYLKFRPPTVAFRVFGVVLLAIAVFLIYIENSQYALFD